MCGATSGRPPTWSSCRWVSTTCFTEPQPRPAALRPSSIAASEPAVPRSTIAASLLRTRMYADTYDMLTRRQSPATAPLAAGTGGSKDSAAAGGGVDDGEEQEPSTVMP